MARTKQTPTSTSKALNKPASPQAAPVPASKVSPQFRFPALIALSIILSSALYTAVSPFTKGDLATVSGHREQWYEITGLLAWKVAELAVGWWGGYDSESATV